jgi:hypothetical protein
MAEKEGEEKQAKRKKASGETAAGAEKTASGKDADETPQQEKSDTPPEGETDARVAEETAQGPAGEKETGLSDEELRRLAEESLEKVTVTDIVITIMNELASVGYMKMGLPESANLRYRDFDQAGLAIDVLEGMIKGAEERVPEDILQPFRGTLANMQMNFVQLKRSQE